MENFTSESTQIRIEIQSATLRKKLLWLATFRVVSLVMLLLGTYLFIPQIAFPDLNTIRRLLIYTGFIFLIPSLIYFPIIFFEQDFKKLKIISYIQVLQDMLFAAVLVLFTGGTSSAFTFFFSLNIIIAGMLLLREGTLFSVAIAFIFITLLALFELNYLKPPSDISEFIIQSNASSVLYNLIMNLVAFTSIGFLSSHLIQQVLKADVQKEEYLLYLKDLRALHEHILKSLDSGIITCDKNWKVVYINPAGKRLLGIKDDNLQSVFLVDLIPEIEPFLGNTSNKFELYLNKNNRVQIFKVNISPLHTVGKMVPGFIVMFEDITKVKELEQKMLAEQRLVTIGKLAAVVAHEIRNPLASISGVVQMIERSGNIPDNQKRLLQIVFREVDHLNNWISDLLDYARPGRAAKLRVDICTVLSNSRDMAAAHAKSNMEIKIQCPEDATYIKGDSQRLNQVFLNLIKNAIDALNEIDRPDKQIVLTVSKKDKDVVITVEDNGPGIPEDKWTQIFQPFFTTKRKGTGLGLAVVEQIIQEHNGTIQVEKSLLGGAKFTIKMPLLDVVVS